MSPINILSLLALASSALAVPFAGHENHQHLHKHAHEARAPQDAPPAYGVSSSSAPYPISSAASGYGTGYYGTGSGYARPTGGWYSWSPGGPGAYSSPAGPEASGPAGYSGAPGGGAAPSGPAGYSGAPGGGAAPSGPAGYSSEATVTAYQTVEVTPSAVPAGYGQGGQGGAGGAGGAGAASGAASGAIDGAQCTADTTITTKVTLTMTVTAHGGSPIAPTFPATSSAAAPPAYSSPAAPESSPAAPVSSPAAPPAYSSPAAPASSPAAPPAYSSPAAPAPVASSPAAAPPAYSAAAASGGESKVSAPASGSSGSSGFSGKVGLAYNDASLASPFVGQPNIGWAYNWVSSSAGLAEGISYIPELHDMTETFTSVWQEQAQAAISAGAEYIFGFNEPDQPSQANLSPEAAAAGWMQYIQPFANQAKLVAPAVSNSQQSGQGLEWLSAFMAACTECTFDAINLHWYWDSNDISELQSQINAGASQANLPVFVGEFGFVGDSGEISSALEQAMGWMDSQDNILGYAYYYLDDGLLLDGSSPSAYGSTYLG